MSIDPAKRPIGFLTDFGYEDEFSAVCRAVIRKLDSGIDVIDISHGIGPGDVRRGAFALSAYAAFAEPSVLLAVVDPGVGSTRKALAVSAGRHFLVGPDNGLLMVAAEKLGGVDGAVEISGSPARLETVSRTFHGRDIFSPVATALASGNGLDEIGEALDPADLVRLDIPVATVADEEIICHVLFSDHYGNLTLNLGESDFGSSFLAKAEAVRVRFSGGPTRMRVCGSFSEAKDGEAVLYLDSSGALSLAVNGGNAAARFGLGADAEVKLAPLP